MRELKFTIAMKKNGLLEKLSNSDDFLVMRSFVWYLDYETKKFKIIVPKWFLTDLWSIPHFMRPFLNRNKYISYVLHDYLYETKDTPKITADLILREAMKVEWAWFLERNIVFIWLLIWWWFARSK